MAEINDFIKQKVLLFLNSLDENGITTEKAYIFGSYAKGVENTMSDIDVAVISQDFGSDRFQERIKIMKIASDIDSKIEPVPFNSNSFIEDDPLVWEIIKNGILIFESSAKNSFI